MFKSGSVISLYLCVSSGAGISSSRCMLRLGERRKKTKNKVTILIITEHPLLFPVELQIRRGFLFESIRALQECATLSLSKAEQGVKIERRKLRSPDLWIKVEVDGIFFFFFKSDTLGSLEGGTFICGARNQWYTRMEGLGGYYVSVSHLRASVLITITSSARRSRAPPTFTLFDSLQTTQSIV